MRSSLSLSRRIAAATTVVAIALTTASTAQAATSHPVRHKAPAHKAAPHKKAVHKKAQPKKKAAPKKAQPKKPAPAATPAAPRAGVTTPAAAIPSPAAVVPAVPEAPVGGIFGPNSFWRQSLVGAPVSSSSAATISTLAAQVAGAYGGVAAFNVWQFNSSVYTVPASQPTADVHWDNCQGKGGVPTGLTGPGGQFTAVPVPDGAVPATGSDAELTVYAPATDQMWDFWHARHASDGWHACWGGRIDHVSASLGYFTGGFGATATALDGEPVSLNDVRAGVINHAVPIAIPSPAAGSYSWPAQRTDGADTSSSAMPEGTRLRLPASLDLSTLGLTPIGLMIARAAQTYGMVVVDRAGAVAVIAESGNGDQALTGTNPWTALLGSTPAYSVMRGFPWAQLQAVPTDWGKPVNAPS